MLSVCRGNRTAAGVEIEPAGSLGDCKHAARAVMSRSDSNMTGQAQWALVGPFDHSDNVRTLPIYTTPFVIGRREDLSLTLASKVVSSVHAELTESVGQLVLRDLGSTNGTFVNGQRLTGPVSLREDDLVQFANLPYRVRQQQACNTNHTVYENLCERALALVQFDKLMTERAVTPVFQPIIEMGSRRIVGYEVLGRSPLLGVQMPKQMFDIAAQLNQQVELSCLLRWEGLRAGAGFGQVPHLFLNTHPRELSQPGLIESMQALRNRYPQQLLTLEIHESAVTESAQMAELRAALTRLNIGLAYDDFGAGQSRLNELIESPPDYLKFDMSLVRGIDSASLNRKQILATLVHMVRSLKVVPLAEGIETEAEAQTCADLGFELGQGYLFGRPAAAH
jgi:EAL domain-containing protein (putative c-di-GMP-specific phosphodiesterase class I)